MGGGDRAIGKGCAVVAALATAAAGSCTAALFFVGAGTKSTARHSAQPPVASAVATATAAAPLDNGRIAIGSPMPDLPGSERVDPRWQHYRAIGPVAREKALRNACPGGLCNPELKRLIIAAADTPIEAASLRNAVTAMEYAASESARERQREAASVRAGTAPAERSAGRVCCCDGSVSPTCTTVKRGCCSKHGGVCACR